LIAVDRAGSGEPDLPGVSSNEEGISFGAAQGFSCDPVAASAHPAELPYEKTANTSETNASVTTAAGLILRVPVIVIGHSGRR
jgi:hypothetical protein